MNTDKVTKSHSSVAKLVAMVKQFIEQLPMLKTNTEADAMAAKHFSEHQRKRNTRKKITKRRK